MARERVGYKPTYSKRCLLCVSECKVGRVWVLERKRERCDC